MQRSFQRDFESLNDIFEFLDLFFNAEHVSGNPRFALRLAAEEFFTNMVKYSKGAENDILIRLSRDKDRLYVRLIESNVDAFDPTTADTAPAKAALQDRRRGGLGIHIVKQMVDDLTYEYRDRTSTVTVIKNLE